MGKPINFEISLQRFCENNKEIAIHFKKYNIKHVKEKDIKGIYGILAQFLVKRDYINQVVECFRREFLIILTIAFKGEQKFDPEVNIRNTIILSSLLDVHPDSNSFILKYFEKHLGPFEVHEGPSDSKLRKRELFQYTNYEFVDACYKLLQFKPEFFKIKWNWSEFFTKFAKDDDPMVKFIYARCLALYTGMNESQLNKYLEILLPKEKINECSVKYLFANKKKEFVSESDEHEYLDINLPEVVCIGGVYLSVYKGENVQGSNLVEVKSMKENLQKIALGIATNKAISLLGPVGSGKTSLVEYIAAKTGRVLGDSFIKVQLGDQTDSKMLLGTYRCTDIPGEFVWQAGVLTQAVLEGSWLLLEDIDSASMDIASVLSGLIENGYLTVPGYRDRVPITSGFQLFLTQRLIPTVTGFHKKHSNVNNLLEKYVLNINVRSISSEELIEIIKTLYPNFETIASRMVSVFHIFSNESTPKNSRLISTRDLFKWCARASIDFDVSSQNSALKVLQDAIDIFCCSYSNPDDVLKLAKEIASVLGIINEKARYFCQEYKPNLSMTENNLIAGRALINRFDNYPEKRIKYCFTRPSACLIERVMCCITSNEPVLLVGETGTGKTSSVQFLAHTIGQKLIVINMNQQSDSADLLGGYKPVDLKFVIAPIKREFETIFKSYFNPSANKKFLSNLNYCFNEAKWIFLIKLMKKSYEAAMNRLKNCTVQKDLEYLKAWSEVGIKLQKLELQLKHKNALAFAFIEGSLVKAVEKGYWVLLDEINLANAETLECLSGLLEGSQGSISLLERGDKKPVKRHSKFTLFACMNPSTDIGKKDLPIGLRNRFTEFFIEELNNKTDLSLLIGHYLEAMSLPMERIEKIVKLYLNIRKESEQSLSDGLGHKPHFSLRSLCRALSIAAKNPCGTFNRSLYEAFCLSFLTQLDSESYKAVENMIGKYLIGGSKEINAVMKQPIPDPKPGEYLQFEGYWVLKGDLESYIPDDYILTESVRRNLKDLVRVVSIGRLPVLLQGDTSVGKTSLITYLAKASGYKCTRINNHEHTDLQEYVGSYAADSEGKLVFREGLLVQAMRKGHWIILDELNLAPTDVLEALNRVLDDNRELFIPETQETIKAHPNFMLFATQNPPGAYGGRKMLSRAFRNRFVELHFNEIPHNELKFILHKRCQMADSYANKMINVMKDLQTRRRGSAAFAGKHGFITLRDLFRWGERYRLAQNINELYDWDQHLADEGYLLLAGRVRKNEERQEIIAVLEKHIKRKVVPENLFTLSEKTSSVTKAILEKIMQNKSKHENIVWTYNMRQLAVLASKALEFQEPVLLVGETGGGKTTVCNLIAENNSQKLITVNCHMHTESSDFLGGLRPVRDHTEENINKLFEWVDGPLVQALISGDLFLADEISLADDSVLERLNSLLEPERTLLLAEKGTDCNNELITAHKNFHFIGTMNPGGDFGKKELSPALRNRFTEIWCDNCNNRQDLIDIIQHNLNKDAVFNGGSSIGVNVMDFIEWFKCQEIGKRFTISIRDILTWIDFINKCFKNIGISAAYLHGACLTFLDSLGSGVTSMENVSTLNLFKSDCISFINRQIKQELSIHFDNMCVEKVGNKFGIDPFYVEAGKESTENCTFSFNAPTTVYNALRLLRGLQLNKALLLEGSPGVGKTSLVTALAYATKNKIFRINLSDQTDISDLFGGDYPVEGGLAGQFSWKDGPLLQALKDGHWILLDELNLASQSVLEGLNACLDHRGEIFIPELGKTFHVKPGTKFFACQNPLKQGGSRRGLPQSFLNRFTQVYLTSLNDRDLYFILSNQFPSLPKPILQKMIDFNTLLNQQLSSHKFGYKGSPWEFNLRDLTRWCETTVYHQAKHKDNYRPESLVQLIFVDRMRTLDDKNKMREIFEMIFGTKITGESPICFVNTDSVNFGDISLKRQPEHCDINLLKQEESGLVLRSQLKVLRNLSYCVNLNWMAILVGSASSGKSSVVHTLAQLSGKNLRTLPVTSTMDTTDILGGFEQADYTRHFEELCKVTEIIIMNAIQLHFVNNNAERAMKFMKRWEQFMKIIHSEIKASTMSEETAKFLQKLQKLDEIWNNLIQENNLVDIDRIKSFQMKMKLMIQDIKKENSLKAGGKFEWVDSILIKCLQDGSWLLVENVNLCSPAVLDRLNALLEPNGVLTIGERGVDKNGKMITIKPHPNFRLFLTMDPKNGEISRAMRNRGVEIYILNSEETTTQNKIDTKSLINHQGLTNSKHINSILEIHNFIHGITLGNKPHLGQLLQASNIIAQKLLRGVNVLEAYTNTIIDIYYSVKSRNEFDTIDAKEEILNKIKFELGVGQENEFYDSKFTLLAKDVQTNSRLAHIKQQVVMVENFMHKTLDATQIFNTTYFLFMHFYTISTKNDLDIRKLYLDKIVRDGKFNKLSKSIFGELGTQNLNPNLPFDFRWVPDTYYPKKDVNQCNRIFVSLFYLTYKIMNEDELEVKLAKRKSFAIIEYLQAVKKQRIEGKIDDPVLKHILDLLESYDIFIHNLFKSELVLENETLIKLLCALQYRFLLYKYLTIKVERIQDIHDVESILNNLHVYYKWFIKFSVNQLENILGVKIDTNLKEIIDRINSNLINHFSVLHKTGKHYQKALEKPPPLINDVQLKIMPEFNSILNSTNIYIKGGDFKRKISLLINKPDLFNNLGLIKREFNYDFENVPENYEQIKIDLQGDFGKVKNSQVVVLPVFDYFTYLKILKYKIKHEGEFKNIKTVPASLLGVLLAYKENEDRKMLHELHSEIEFYMKNAACVVPEIYFNQGSEMESVFAMHTPVFTYLMTELLIDYNGYHLTTVTTLGNYRDSLSIFKQLHGVLWKNVQQISDDSYDYMLCEIEYLKSSFMEFCIKLGSTLEIKFDPHFESFIQLCITKIENMYQSKNYKDAKYEKTLLTQLLLYMHEEFMKLSSDFEEINILNAISNMYMILNYFKALLNSKLPFIDPLSKVTMKKNNSQMEIQQMKDLKESFILQNKIYSDDENNVHSLCVDVDTIIPVLIEKNIQLGKYVAVRPDDLQYQAIRKHLLHGFVTVLSPLKFLEMYTNLNLAITNFESDKELDLQLTETKLKHAISTSNSCESFIRGLLTYRFTYPDVVEPILCNVLEFLHGLQLKISILKKLIMQCKHKEMNIDLNFELCDLLKFPSMDEDKTEKISIIENYVNDRINNFIMNTLDDDESEVKFGKRECFNLLKSGIIEINNLCNIDGEFSQFLDGELFAQFNILIKMFVDAWKKQEVESAAKKKEEESLYKTRTKCDDKTEEEQAEEEFKKLFVSYHDKDFNDLKEVELGDDPMDVDAEEFSSIIKIEDIQFVSGLHSDFMLLHTKTEWLSGQNNTTSFRYDHLTPLLQKFKLYKLLLNKSMDCLSYKMNAEILGGLNVLVNVAKYFGDSKCLDEKSGKYNYYNDPNIEEVKSCYHILAELQQKINEFLNEWPEHPTLKTIESIIERIYNFEITSPLPRFLTGFDILLTKCHEWEENAHSGVSLAQYTVNIGQQMVTWRKLEMNNWKNALDNSYTKLTAPVSKFWFYIYDIMREYIEIKLFGAEELISSLQKFILQSNIAEFALRVQLLNVYHCHATYLPKSTERDNFISILWNLYKYYEQFIPSITARIKSLRTPIEKKLKDYIKIVRWKDISYWALKEALLKTHKTIYKHMREFEDILRQPVAPLLVNTSTNQELVGVQDRPQRTSPKHYHYTLDSVLYVTKMQAKTLPNLDSSTSVLTLSEKYLKKSKMFCQNLISNSKYPELIKELDCFLGQVIATCEHLQGLEITASLPKEKKISQAKSHLQQKQRALSDLFKTLSKIGLSFRKGIIEFKQKDLSAEYLIKPIDLSAAMSHIQRNRSDDKLLIMWDGVEFYYRKSFMRMDILDAALKNPSKDLGMQNIERCKGFGAHLMLLAQKQKTQLVESTKQLYVLRHYQSLLSDACELRNFVPCEHFVQLNTVLKNAVLIMQQYKLIFLACPEENLLDSDIVNIPVLTPAGDFIQSKGDEKWNKIAQSIETIKSTCQKLLKALQKVKFVLPYSSRKIEQPKFVYINNYNQIFDGLNLIKQNLIELNSILGSVPLSKSAQWIHSEIVTLIEYKTESDADANTPNTFQSDIENLVSNVLLIIQNIYKKHENPTKPSESKKDEEEEVEKSEGLLENHLNKLVIDDISDDIVNLNIPTLVKSVKRVVKFVCKMDLTKCAEEKNLIQCALPFLEQAILLYQYYITQQVSSYRITCKITSVLLNIFIDLANKGFCIPPELSEEMSEEGQKSSSGMGLGDGEGEKDASERIESEDQLEDAQPAGQEKEKEEDKDCKEEEKGIEMSEDFESKLQDVEKKPEDDSDEESNESDADEQMGDTEKGADQLDKEVWGSDNEEEPPQDEEEGKKEEKGNKGEDQGEQELAANESSQNPAEEQDDAKEEKEKKKKKDEINEMDEPELDDNQVDPYHGNQPELPEPEPLDLPDDLKLDSDGEQEEQGEENPFDIDAMKEQMPEPEVKEPEETEKESKDENEDKGDDDSSDEEESENQEQKEDEGKEVEDESEENKEKMQDEGVSQKEEDKEKKDDAIEDNQQSASDEKETNEENVESADIDQANSADKVETQPSKEQKTDKPNEEVSQEDSPDKEGIGQSQMEDSRTGHKGQANAEQASDKEKLNQKDNKKRSKPGETDTDRTLGDPSEPIKKKMKTISADNAKEEEEVEEEEEEETKEEDAEMYQHIKEAKEKSTQVMDTISKEQAEKLEKKQVPNKEDENVEDEATESQKDLPEEENDEDDDVEMKDINQQKAEKSEQDKSKRKEKRTQAEGDVLEELKDIEVEGEVIQTHMVPRGGETTHHTQYNELSENVNVQLTLEEMNKLRSEVESQLSIWNQSPTNMEAEKAWQKISSITSSLAQDLSEQLRLVLEPTQASSLKGDFRTGRRINMRKVIPYIASQFRKDKIWLRRTKPSKREYQIVLAIDDSSSMADNHSKELAFESVALISKALTLLESGQLSILSFGETTEVLHKLSDTFTDKSGTKLLQKFQFDQKKTCVAKLVDFATEMLNNAPQNVSSLLAKLLVIVSDGRGIFSEGETYVHQAIRRAKLSNIFMIFVIIDNPENNQSVLDILKPVFTVGKKVEIKSYMDAFPFPFYLILRDINSLPSVLSDALRQWFEIVSNVDKQ